METGEMYMIEGYLYRVTSHGTLEWMPPIIGKLEFSL